MCFEYNKTSKQKGFPQIINPVADTELKQVLLVTGDYYEAQQNRN